MNGWLTIKTKLLTNGVKTGLKEISDEVDNAEKNANNMNSSFNKLALTIAIIVGLLSFLTSGFETILNDNKELNNQVQGIKNAFSNLAVVVATLLEPVITTIVNWIYKLMAYLNVITKQFFGIDLFSQKTNKNVAGTAKSLKSGAKSAKEIKKQLASFDEMNVLSENKSSGGGGGGTSGGIGTETKPIDVPSIDTSKFEAYFEKFKTKIGEMKDNFVQAWDFILNTDKNEAKKLIDQQGGNWGTLKLGVFEWLHGITNIISGFYDAWSGVFEFIVGLFTGNTEKIENGVRKIKDGIIKVLKGLVSTIDSMKDMIWGIIKGIGKTIYDFVKDKVISPIINKIKDIVKSIKENFKDGLWKGILNTFIGLINKVINKINDKLTISIGKTLSAILKGLGINVSTGKYSLFTIPNIPKLAKGGIVNSPSRGVNMGSYIAGEKGAEAVIPLTDDTLQRLASMIPITIDLTNTIDGRVLNRRLETIRMNDSFAGNR